MGQSKKVFRIITVLVGQPPKIEFVEDPFSHAQKLLNGLVEVVRLADGNQLLCDEDGISKRLPFNRVVPDIAPQPLIDPQFVVKLSPNVAEPGQVGEHRIRGPFIVAKWITDYESDDGGYNSDLSDGDVERYVRYLGNAGSHICERCGNNPSTVGQRYCGAACSQQAEMHL